MRKIIAPLIFAGVIGTAGYIWLDYSVTKGNLKDMEIGHGRDYTVKFADGLSRILGPADIGEKIAAWEYASSEKK